MHAASPKGFAAVARDHAEAPLDLHRLMVPRPAATFFMRMQGDAMVPHIHSGDLLVVDRSLEPRAHRIVVFAARDEFLVRRWEHTSQGVVLRAENPRHPPRRVADLEDFRLFGVVTWTVREMRNEE